MADTRTEIIRLGEELIRTRGYHAFSYKDISEPLQIKNAAVHYYFASKTDLGVTIIENTYQNFLRATESWSQLPYQEQLEKFIEIYQESKNKNWVCLMGALSPPYDSLPKELQLQIEKLGREIIEWLVKLLEKGLQDQSFTFKEPARAKAHLIVGAILSSLQLNKVIRGSVFDSIKTGILSNI